MSINSESDVQGEGKIEEANINVNNVNFDCVELDKVSSNLLRKLYPNQKVYNLGFEAL